MIAENFHMLPSQPTAHHLCKKADIKAGFYTKCKAQLIPCNKAHWWDFNKNRSPSGVPWAADCSPSRFLTGRQFAGEAAKINLQETWLPLSCWRSSKSFHSCLRYLDVDTEQHISTNVKTWLCPCTFMGLVNAAGRSTDSFMTSLRVLIYVLLHRESLKALGFPCSENWHLGHFKVKQVAQHPLSS